MFVSDYNMECSGVTAEIKKIYQKIIIHSSCRIMSDSIQPKEHRKDDAGNTYDMYDMFFCLSSDMSAEKAQQDSEQYKKYAF